jgi:alpha-mannosidase
MTRSVGLLALALAFLATTAPGQTLSRVDMLITALDSLTGAAYDGWRMSPDLRSYRPAGDPSRRGFDDSKWEVLRLRQSVTVDSCWLRKEITLPPTMLGLPVKGALKFLVSVDDYGHLWVNGETRGHFPWNGEFELTRNAAPGQTFVIAIKAINTGGPLRLLRAEFQMEAVRATRSAIEDFALSLRVGQKLLSFDTYQTSGSKRTDPGTDRSSIAREERNRLQDLLQDEAAKLDAAALAAGDIPRFTASLERARKALTPVAEFAKRFTLFFDANAHIDAAWLWRQKETIEVCRNTFQSVLNMMQVRPDFTYTQSAALYYDWMERLAPDVFRAIQARVAEGRWEITGGMWVEPDCNIPSGESWARHLLYAKRYFRQKLSTDVTIGWNPDSFGYTLSMPMFYRAAGIDAFITQKIGWNDTNVFPHRLFWWESPDGSRILSFFPFDYVNTVENPFAFVDWLRQYEANTGLRKLMILFGIGNHGGGPSLEMLGRIDRLRGLDIFPAIEFGTAAQYLAWVRSQDLGGLPVWDDELYLEYHQGTFTTQAAMKRANRTGETLLTNAEKFSALAGLSGRPYGSGRLEETWKELLYTQFHDILPGSSIREVYIDTRVTHEEIHRAGSLELHAALDHLASQVNTSTVGRAQPLVVFNALAWKRTDLVRVPLADGDTNAYTVLDPSGKEIPSQVLRTGKLDRELVFIARDVPPLGYATYSLRPGAAPRRSSALKASRWSLENRSFTLAVDSATGWLRSITDRRHGREVLSGPGNELQLLEDLPAQWDAWNIGWTGTVFPSTFRTSRVVSDGPVAAILRLERDYLKPGTKRDYPTEDFPTSFFTQDIILYDGLDRIDFVTGVDWWEDRTMLKVAFPLALSDTAATFEIPYGTIRRSTLLRDSWEKAKVEVPASRWADLSAGEYGVSLINTDKYGYDVKGSTLRLSLLRSPKWPDPTADRGSHTIRYSLYPHAGSWASGGTVRQGYGVNVPLIARFTDTHRGKMPAVRSYLSLEPGQCVLTSLKKAEDSDAWVLQWYNTSDAAAEAVLKLPARPGRAVLSNFLEEDGAPLPVTGEILRVPTQPRAVVTAKVWF